jgi:O-antigen ligase
MTLLLARLGIGFSLILLAFGPWLLAGSDPWYVSLLAWPWLATIICWLLLPLGGSGLPVRGGTILVCLLGLMAVTLFQTLPIPPDLARLLSPALQSRLALLVPENAENAWVTLSADPSATFDLFTRMAAITLLYQATRGLMVCAGGVFALAVTGWVLLVNGALLSLVAIAQSVTSAPDVVYWTWLTPGRVFGPFVCKNHYPYYMSMALGSAFGLVGAAYHDMAPRSREGRLRRDQFWDPFMASLRSPVMLLQHPAVLGVVLGLTVMIASIPMSMSRGGVVASIVSLLATVWVVRRVSPRWTGTGALPLFVLAFLPLIALLSWFGMSQVEARLATLTKLETFQDDRFSLWVPLLKLVAENPVVGTGGGTVGLVEPLARSRSGFIGVVVDHAHNEYLEAAVEGGIIRLALTLLLAGVIVRQAWRAVRRHAGTALLPMAAGLMYGAVAVLVHNIADFGMHMAAVSALAAVILAQLDYMASPESSIAPGPESRHKTIMVSGWFSLPMVVPALVVFLAFQAHGAAYRLQVEADSQPLTEAGSRRKIGLYQAAIALRPRSAEVREALGLALIDEVNRRVVERVEAGDLQTVPLMLAGVMGAFPDPPLLSTAMMMVVAGGLPVPQAEIELEADLRQQAFAALRKAVALSPLLHRSQTALSLDPEMASPAEALEKSARAFPIDHELWWTAGRAWWNEAARATDMQSADALRGRALSAWREALGRGSGRLPEILEACLEVDDPDRYLALVLPDQPRVLLGVAKSLKPGGANTDRRNALLSLARRELEARGISAEAADWRALADMSPPGEEKVDALRRASLVAAGPTLASIRLDLAWELEALGQLDEAEGLVHRLEGNSESPRVQELLKFLQRDRELEPFLPSTNAKD